MPETAADTFRHATLANGLTVIAEPLPAAHSAAVGCFVRTGARDETADVMGVSHFLEHMLFKGTTARSGDDINRGFDEIGARHNAYTSHEVTCYHAQTLADALPAALDLLLDMLRPALRAEDFQAERGVILEEIAMYKDDPFWSLYDHANETRYGAAALGYKVLGTTETIQEMTHEQMRTYFESRYAPDNITVALAGNTDFDAAVAQIEQATAAWTPSSAGRDTAEPATNHTDFTLTDETATGAYALLLAGAPAGQDDRRYAAALLAQALGDPDNGLLHWALVDTGLAEDASASYDGHDGGGTFGVFAACEPVTLARVEDAMLGAIETLPASLTQETLDRLRSKIATSTTLAAERPGGRMQRLGRQWLLRGQHTTLDAEVAQLNAVTLDEVQEVAAAFPFRPRTLGRLTPGGSGPSGPPAAGAPA